MSPLVLVAILTIWTCAHADVKHVLDGSAHVPSPKEINGLSSSNSYSASASFAFEPASGHGTFQAPGKADFWWMDTNSPLKHAYDYFKKCQEKGDCLPPVNPSGCTSCTFNVGATTFDTKEPLDLKKNPFLNGEFQNLNFNGCSGGDCKEGAQETTFTTCKGTECKTSKVTGDLSKNPFLNGGLNFGSSSASFTNPITGPSSGTASGSSSHGGSIDISKNPFLSGLGGKNSGVTGNGELVFNNGDGFLGVQPAQPFGGHKTGGGKNDETDENPKLPFSTTHPGVQSCKQGHVCVSKEYCADGRIAHKEGDAPVPVRNVSNFPSQFPQKYAAKAVCFAVPSLLRHNKPSPPTNKYLSDVSPTILEDITRILPPTTNNVRRSPQTS